ncbi:hypothetical protein BDQ12DRAFT_245872 [Crucibulum laeve]|uniref:Uncharacterized protein n=1 Tax=Crucibulum laeve TaxID=68775 RepID=A0A5C3LTS1_9AGAR|nr:hypothetical protein BDQ12DRAFT_245872 [Crucibulum laeve]
MTKHDLLIIEYTTRAWGHSVILRLSPCSKISSSEFHPSSRSREYKGRSRSALRYDRGHRSCKTFLHITCVFLVFYTTVKPCAVRAALTALPLLLAPPKLSQDTNKHPELLEYQQ